ncbi:hypothetical protein ACKF11_13610 [Methylobacillus sp. Pita2]|uniref:hypothetical protein n=1 Tax=Methylobacillus sp. Pita2 TaxID=3383245 RepID=UPI0038B6AC9E
MKYLYTIGGLVVVIGFVAFVVDIAKVESARGEHARQSRIDDRYVRMAEVQKELMAPCMKNEVGHRYGMLECIRKSISHASDYEVVLQIAEKGIAWQNQYGANSDLQHEVIQGLQRAEINARERQAALNADHALETAEANSWVMQMFGLAPEESKSLEGVISSINVSRGNIIKPTQAHRHQHAGKTE